MLLCRLFLCGCFGGILVRIGCAGSCSRAGGLGWRGTGGAGRDAGIFLAGTRSLGMCLLGFFGIKLLLFVNGTVTVGYSSQNPTHSTQQWDEYSPVTPTPTKT